CRLYALRAFACVFFYGYGARRDLHSFPTRRSSDLHRVAEVRVAVRGTAAEEVWVGELSSGKGSPRVLWSGIAGPRDADDETAVRSEEHTSELQSLTNLVCRLLLEKKNNHEQQHTIY